MHVQAGRGRPWALAAAATVAGLSTIGLAAGAGQGGAPPLVVDAFVFDGQGRPVAGLGPEQFSVIVDGTPRTVVSARYVYRGPGAEAAARGAARADAPTASPLFEPRRTILVVIDETSFPRGGEKTVAAAADRLLDRFGPGDQVALVTVPLAPEALAVSFATDRAGVRDTLARLVGRGADVDLLARAGDAPPDGPVVDTAGASAAGSSAAGVDTLTAARPVEEPQQQAQPAADQAVPSGERREHPLETITRLLAALRVAPGPKTLVLTSAGLPDVDRSAAAAERAALQAAEAAAAASRTVVCVLGVQPGGRAGNWSDLEHLSSATGGELVRAGRNVDQALDRIGQAVAGAYRLDIEAAPTDRDGRALALEVGVARANLTVRSASRLVPRDDPPALAIAAPPPRAMGARDLPDDAPASPVREGGRGRRGVAAADPELDTIVARSAEYVAGYFREFRNVVAEEDYTQTISAGRLVEARRLKSDFLLVTAPDGRTWVPFRDVFEVDGRPVRDREDRLRKLFLESPPGTAFEATSRVQEEGARYNLVSLGKTDVNVPTFALLVLLNQHLAGFEFRRGREETVEGAHLLRVDFDERARPTLIHSPDGVDAPSSGSFWVEPLTGRVVKTLLRATRAAASDALAGLEMDATVVYRRSDTLGLWVPAEMREAYRLRGSLVEGRASYSRFRSFQVRTEQEIKSVK